MEEENRTVQFFIETKFSCVHNKIQNNRFVLLEKKEIVH
jgi:hypothetical protein